jgi:photosystem II stability/assembly factor-like uncharacterized protein
MKTFHTLLVLTVAVLLAQPSSGQDIFARRATIPVPIIENSGLGNMVSGVDFDGDGKTEIYAVNNNWNDTGAELIPRIYKFEKNVNSWDSVWSATLNIPLQNTWPTLTYGDLDNDGRQEIIWGPVNNLNATTNPNPARIIVFESRGDGTDNMGVPDGGGWRPNAKWTITSTAMQELRPFKWFLYDIDRDNKKEIIFADRQANYRFGVVGVSSIPNTGDSSETWTLKASGLGAGMNTSVIYDIAVLDSTIFVIHSNGVVTPVTYAAGVYRIRTGVAGLIPGGSWKASEMVDIDNNGTKEIVVGSWATGVNAVYLMRKTNDTTLTRDSIANLALGTGSRIYGIASGDIDNDSRLDFVFGSRDATPNAAIMRLKYLGGNIGLPSSYAVSRIDQNYAAGGRWDIFGFVNNDADLDREVVYSNGIDGRVPLIILDRIPVTNLIPIAEARKDTDRNYIPDRLGDTVTVIGLVNSVNYTASANRFTYYIQDGTGGLSITKGSETGGGPVYSIGTRLIARGAVAQFNGVVQLNIPNLAAYITFVDSGNTVTPTLLRLDQYLGNAELYEGTLIQFNGLRKAAGSPGWPPLNSDSNMVMTDGVQNVIFRVDRDTDLDNNPEPTYPINVIGVATQFTTATPPNDGYQITPNFYAQITQNVQVPPNRNFRLLSPANNTSIVIDTTASYNFTWRKTVDINNDPFQYFWQPVARTGSLSNNSGADTVKTVAGSLLASYMGTAEQLVFRWTVMAKDAANPAVSSLDTFAVTFFRSFTPPPAGWFAQTSGVTSYLYSVKAVNANVAWAAGGGGTVLRTTNSGTNWTGVGGGRIGTADIYNIDALDANTAFVTTSPAATYIFRTTNAGTSWDTVFTQASGFINAIKMFDATNGIAEGDPVGGKWTIARTTNGGTTWARIATEPAQVGGEFGTQNGLSTVGTTHIWYNSNTGGRIYRSTNGGQTWTTGTAPTGVTATSNVWFNNTQYGVATSSSSNAVFRSIDGGATWSSVTVAGTGFLIACGGSGNQDFWYARGTTMYRSVNFGATFATSYTGTGTYVGLSFVTHGSTTTGWAVTSTGGIARFYGTTTGVDERTPQLIPETFDLAQNFPNPFNPTTTIRYALPKDAFVSLKVYNILGQEIVTLKDELQSVGTFNILWNGRNNAGSQVASGMYLYRIVAKPADGSQPFTALKKMILLK